MDPPQRLPADLRDPSTLFFQQPSVRRSVIAGYWAVIILALPIWWYTTSIERLPLPISQASQEIRRHLELPVRFCVQEDKLIYAPLIQQALQSRNVENLRFEVFGQTECGNSPDVYTIKSGQTRLLYERTIEFPLKDRQSVDELSTILVSLVAPKQDQRTVQFASRYRLAFSLLNEDAASGNMVVGWNIQDALKRYINPILHRMSQLHNYTIESQVQFHAPLAFEVKQLDNGEHGLSYEDLTVFVNSAEWTLSSSFSNDPVIHLVLFIPSTTHSPLRIVESDGTISTSNSFILPQWGGIVLYSLSEQDIGTQLSPEGLHASFSSFAHQLLSLLGAPQLPSGVHRDPRDRNIISDWQMDALLRRRTLETVAGTKETLRSFIKLVNRIENMPIGQSVSDDVHNALSSLNKVYDYASTSLEQAFTYSAGAFDLASRAFFNPGMVALLYFPAEHKYAVYAPLFASAMVPLFVAALRELKAWKAQRRRQAP